MRSKKELHVFPDTIEGFGYAFNEEGALRKIDPKTGLPGDEPFTFSVKDDSIYNQARYEALGDLITEHVYKLLEDEAGLKKLSIPQNGSPELSSFIYASNDALDNPEKLVLFIHGSGVVRAGQWARSLIINDNLNTGTQLPYIMRAKELGYGVLVLNGNDNERTMNGKKRPIPGNESALEHCNYVWNTYIKEAKAKHIAIIAHSYGGACALHLAAHHLLEFRDRVCAVALTDSVHYVMRQKVSAEVINFLIKLGRNWVTSSEPLDTFIPSRVDDIKRVSAGNTRHEMTSASSFESVFEFLGERFECAAASKL